jgi:SpoVK/Ycf46/Vps4 family AAA+-type ATPase
VATAEQLKALLRSYVAGDEEHFLAIAMQLAAQAARQGHGKLAIELRQLIDEAKSKGHAAPPRPGTTPLVEPRGELSGVIAASYPKTRLDDVIATSAIRRRLDRVLHEHRQHHKLSAHGLSARRKLLLLGPPGTGKTMTAAALAGELGWPLFTILLDGLITKFMGETAAKLRLVFDSIRQVRGVYLFDEFDAIGGKRTAANDVGEIRRVLNSFLQFLEQDNSSSIIVAATNHPELLDRALYRRFDDVVGYELPTPSLTSQILRARLSAFDVGGLDWKRVNSAARGLSYAEISRGCEEAAKIAILDDRRELKTQDVVDALQERKASRT